MIEVLSVASEVYPLIKTGGLADVAGALPHALAGHGVSMRTLLPGYPAVLGEATNGRVVAEIPDLFGGPARLIAGRLKGLDCIVVDAGFLFERAGNPYTGPDGRDWPDNWRRFAALGWIAGELGLGLVPGYRPQVIHCHDWQAGLAPAYVKFGPSASLKTVMTVHNMAFQGYFGAEIFGQLRLPPHAFGLNGVEFWGGVSYLKSGMECADMVTTVSPTYAAEIRTPQFGLGLEGVLNARSETVFGTLNGIDIDEWDPVTDKALKQNYSTNTLHLRRANKAALAERFGLDGTEGPLFGVVSRLTEQKGLDLLAQCVGELVGLGGRLCILGSGEAYIENLFHAASKRFPGKVGFITGYDESLSRLVQGGADVMLVPSRFEPCGLTQLYGLRYGCVPVVARVGGLADTVIHANEAALTAGVATGVQFEPGSVHHLTEALRRTVELYADKKTWSRMQRRGMKSDVSWEASAKRYADLYATLTGVERDDDPED